MFTIKMKKKTPIKRKMIEEGNDFHEFKLQVNWLNVLRLRINGVSQHIN